MCSYSRNCKKIVTIWTWRCDEPLGATRPHRPKFMHYLCLYMQGVYSIVTIYLFRFIKFIDFASLQHHRVIFLYPPTKRHLAFARTTEVIRFTHNNRGKSHVTHEKTCSFSVQCLIFYYYHLSVWTNHKAELRLKQRGKLL